MDVLLITTPFYPLNYSEVIDLPLSRQERTSVTPPLGVSYLSAHLKQKGYRVKILDLDLEIFHLIKQRGVYFVSDIVSLIKSFGHFDVIGISCFCSARYKQAHQLAKIAKSLANIVVMGGNYPTNSPQEALKNCDYVVLGEGEDTFYRLLRALEEGVGLEEIDGIGYKDKIIPKTSFIQDLDSLPFPDYDNLDLERYYDLGMSQSLEGGKRFLTLFTSRGCPHRCIYCGAHNTFGYKNRVRSVDNVLSEIDWLRGKFNVQELIIQDDNFTSDRKRADKILDNLILRELSWCIPNGLEASTIDRAFLEKVKSSGCSDLSIAVESGSPKVLKMIRKKVDLEKTKQVIKDMRELGIYSKVFFMIGFPGETKEDIQKTIDYASELKADWSSFSIVNPLPGTELWDSVKTDFSNIGYANANITTEDFNPKYIEKVVAEANKRINFLENPNLTIGNRGWAIRDFKRIAERYPQHQVAKEALRKAFDVEGG